MISLLAATAFACPNLDAEVDRATLALVGGDFPGARAGLEAAAASFACAPATREQAARYWLVEGATALLEGKPDAARAPLAAARTAAPDGFDERLGPKVRAAWAAATPEGVGTLLLEPQRPAKLDGVEVTTWPTAVDATPHLVQVVDDAGTVHFYRLVPIAPGEDALLETGLGTGPLDVAAPVEPRKKPAPILLILAGVAAAGAGACAGGALAQNPIMDDAKNLTALETAFERQKLFGYSSYGLMGLTAVSVGLHFAIPSFR